MSDPTSVLLAGDWHGNTTHAREMVKRATAEGCDRIFQLGDFGYWEHDPSGVKYLDQLNRAAVKSNIVVYFCDGNHDKTSLLLEKYTERDAEGFIVVRPSVRYAPRGHRWTWGAVRFIALGGAYSVDKRWRLGGEAIRSAKIREENSYRTTAQQRSTDTSGTLWFPEEEMTDADLAGFLADESPVDVIVCHDKPRSSAPDWNRKDLAECWSNQDRIQLAARTLRPALIAHGHLHYRYTDTILVGDDVWCRVEGLDADPESAEGVSRTDSWMVLPLDVAPARPVVSEPSEDEKRDRLVAEWHDAPDDSPIARLELHEHLGMTWDEYRKWVEG